MSRKNIVNIRQFSRARSAPTKSLLKRVPNRAANPHIVQLDDMHVGVRGSGIRPTLTCTIRVDYIPADWMIETKSLLQFLREIGDFVSSPEDCALRVARELVDAISPIWLRISGNWDSHADIHESVFWQTAPPPADVELPD